MSRASATFWLLHSFLRHCTNHLCGTNSRRWVTPLVRAPSASITDATDVWYVMYIRSLITFDVPVPVLVLHAVVCVQNCTTPPCIAKSTRWATRYICAPWGSTTKTINIILTMYTLTSIHFTVTEHVTAAPFVHVWAQVCTPPCDCTISLNQQVFEVCAPSVHSSDCAHMS